jgi:Transposase IS116/IS110/IS902 family
MPMPKAAMDEGVGAAAALRPASPAREFAAFLGLTPKQNSSGGSEEADREALQARRRGGCQQDGAHRLHDYAPQDDLSRDTGVRSRRSSRLISPRAKALQRISGQHQGRRTPVAAEKAEDMTAPTISVPPKITLDQRAP